MPSATEFTRVVVKTRGQVSRHEISGSRLKTLSKFYRRRGRGSGFTLRLHPEGRKEISSRARVLSCRADEMDSRVKFKRAALDLLVAAGLLMD